MKKRVLRSFLILAGSTTFSKFFSLLNRMLLARLLDKEGMGLYMLALPTLGLCMTLGEFGIPSALFRLVASPKYKNHKVIYSCLCLTLGISILIGISLFLLAPFISQSLLKNQETYLSILSLALLIPLLSFNALIKNYYLGIGKVGTLSLCQFLEEIARLAFTYFFITSLSYLTLSQKVGIVYLSMTFEEVIATFFLFIVSRKKIPSFFKLLSSSHSNFIYKDVLEIAIPHTFSRLINSLASFLQPIILTQYLLYLNYSQLFIQESYGILTGYVIALLSTPSFFTGVVYRILFPIISEDVYHHNKKLVYKHMMYGLLACFLLALPFTCIFYFFPNQSLSFIYNTQEGANLLKYLAIPYITSYLQTPLSVVLQALNKNITLFFINLLTCLSELILMVLLIPHYQVLSIALALILSTILSLGLSSLSLFSYLFKDNK